MIALTAVMPPSYQSVLAANTAPQNVPLKKVKYERHNQDLDIDGRRSPAKPIMCVISGEGISLDIADDVETYEIWDGEGNACIAAYSDELDFTNHLFGVPGEYRIVFATADYYYIGYISTL